MKDKIIGILGGMGPEATIDLFARIVKHTHAKKDDDHLRIIIDNNPKMPSRQDAILKGGESPVPAMQETARNLERAGADFIIIGANTAHYFYDDVKDAVHIPVMHIIEEAAKETIRIVSRVKKVGVLATTAAMKTGLYQKSFEKYGIEVLRIPEDVQSQVQNSIFTFKYEGCTPKVIEMMAAAARHMIADGAGALVMGCTEIPIILEKMEFSVPLIDPNESIALAAVQYAKNQRTL
ncbi:MAG: amino acid racemase [Desulfobacteraceae bacterium]|nr:amino acid racemase [Desulfobacteraceae bacterium]